MQPSFKSYGLNHLIHMDSFYNAFITLSGLLSFGYLVIQWRDQNLSGFIKNIMQNRIKYLIRALSFGFEMIKRWVNDDKSVIFGWPIPLKYVTLDHKTSLKSLGYICSNIQQYIVWVKIIDFSFMPKIIRTLSKDHVSSSMKIFCKFPTVNISKLNFWLVIWLLRTSFRQL